VYEKLKNAKVLVTGGAGFIGSHLSRRLLDLGAYVVVLDNLSTGDKNNLKSCLDFPNFDFFQGDVNIREQVAHVFNHEKIDYVFHGAAVVGVKRVEEDPLLVLRDIDGIRNILELARVHGVKKVVFCSSSEAYGEPQTLPEREDGPINPNPRDPYALVKLQGENLIRIYAEKMGLPGCSLRYFNVYGRRQATEGAYCLVMGIFIRQRLAGKPMTITGDGQQRRDYTNVDDVAWANILAAQSQKVGRGEVINIGRGHNYSVSELAKMIGGPVVHLPPRIEPRATLADNSLAEKLIGWQPKADLPEWLVAYKKEIGL